MDEKKLDEQELELVTGGNEEDIQKWGSFLNNNCFLCETWLFCSNYKKFTELGKDPDAHCPSFVPKK